MRSHLWANLRQKTGSRILYSRHFFTYFECSYSSSNMSEFNPRGVIFKKEYRGSRSKSRQEKKIEMVLTSNQGVSKLSWGQQLLDRG